LSLDDSDYVTYNPLVTNPGWSSTLRFFGEVIKPSTFKGYYHPLAMTSLMLDYAMGGRPDDLRAFHRTSLALHVLNTMLIVLLIYRLFGSMIPAGIIGLAFGLHPLTVEPTAWVGERKTLLAAFFALSCVLSYVQYVRHKGRAWIASSLVCFLLALLSKPTATMLPLVLLLLDYWPLRRLGFQSLREKAPFLFLALIFGALTIISQHQVGGIGETTASDYLRWPLRACYTLAFYLVKIARPTNLSCIYPQPGPFTVSNPVVLLAVVCVAALSAVVVAARRRTRAPLVGWLIFVIALAPTLGLVKYTWVITFDNYVYLPALGFLVVLGSGLTSIWTARHHGIAPKVLCVVLGLLILTAETRGTRMALRNWTDSLTLYRHMERVAPDSPVVQNRLGILLDGETTHPEAIRHMQRALQLEPAYGDAHYNLGIVLASSGNIDESIRHFQMAVALMPESPDAAYNLGLSLRLANRLDEAAAQFRQALRLRPEYLEARDQLGGILVVQGRTQEAVDQLRTAAGLAPSSAPLQFRLSMALLLLGGHSREAVERLRQACREAPTWPTPFNALAWLLATSPDSATRDPAEALRLATRAVDLTGARDARVLDTLAAAEAATGDFEHAIENGRRAFELASQSRGDSLASGMRERVVLYQHHRAYTEPATSVPGR
jgi:tetratricopeptide (TPR) repeat protein